MWEVIKYLAGKLFDLALKSDKLSIDTLTKVAEVIVDDVTMRVQIVAQLHDMARRAESVRDAFAPDGSVPDLGIDVEIVKPE